MNKTIAEVTQGNFFRNNDSVTLPTGERFKISKRILSIVPYAFQDNEVLVNAFGCASNDEFRHKLRQIDNSLTVLGCDRLLKFSNISTLNKILKIIWSEHSKNKNKFNYKPKQEYLQAINTVLGGNVREEFEFTREELVKFEEVGLVDIMFDKVEKIKLPEINGYTGKIQGDLLVYGCAKLPLVWFKKVEGATRSLSEISLNNGIKIRKEHVISIQLYLKNK